MHFAVLWEFCSNIELRGTVISASLASLKWMLSADYFAAPVECVVSFKQPNCPDFPSFQVQYTSKLSLREYKQAQEFIYFVFMYVLQS